MNQSIEWCLDQQRQALRHLAPGHKCSERQCCPGGARLWLNDAFAEELELREKK